MSRTISRLLVSISILAVALAPAQAQFIGFGQNKITYDVFDWHVYHSPHFDVYYYPEEEQFLEEVVSYAESAYLKLSRDLDHELKVRVPLVIYKTRGEFQQTNITMAELPQGVAAFAEPVQYRMVLPIDNPPDMLYELIAHELTHIFEYSIFFEGYLGRALRSRPPTWLMEGLASYMGDDESTLDQMVIRDAVVNNILPPIQALSQVTFLTYRFGHAIFDYIAEEHGEEGLRSFIFEFKKVILTGNVGKAIKEAFGYDIDEFNRRFDRYLRQKYFPILMEKKSPDEYGTEIGLNKPGVFTFSPTISPSGELVAALSAPKMEIDMVVLSAEDGSLVKNVTKGWTNRYRWLGTAVFNGKRDLSWSPTADHVAIFTQHEDLWPLEIHNAITGKLVGRYPLKGIVGNASPAFSPDGKRIAFEGNRDGVVDIFELDLETSEIRNLTQDDFFDANPFYAPDGETLVYNRRIGEHEKVFSVDVSDASRKTQITYGKSTDLQPSYSRDGSRIYFSSDRTEETVFNIYELELETGTVTQYTDVVGGCFAPVEMAERDGERYLVFQAFFGGMFRLYRMPLREPEKVTPAAERMAAATEVDAEPFEPALDLRIDEEQKGKYKLKWDVEMPSLTIGVADDGTILANGALSFTDLLGDHRIMVGANTVSDFASFGATYINLKRRFNWGGNLFDFRDFFYVNSEGGIQRKTEYAARGGDAFIDYPLNRYYRATASVGVLDTSRVQPTGVGSTFARFDDTFATFSASLVGDTTRYQVFGPFQGKRFNLTVRHGAQITGDGPGDYLEYRFDFRAYKQLTRRSLIAWRVATIYNDGEAQNTYGFGDMNQLRGFEYREFNGSRLAWSNLELRFPLVDSMNFPVLRLVNIRGFLYLDVGTSWFPEDLWYDPRVGNIRQDTNNEVVGWQFWDSDNNQFADGRASYGFGFAFRFIGNMQFNWVWSRKFKYTQAEYESTFYGARVPLDDAGNPIFRVVDDDDFRMDFYIGYDF